MHWDHSPPDEQTHTSAQPVGIEAALRRLTGTTALSDALGTGAQC
jgi:hypothetical protein